MRLRISLAAVACAVGCKKQDPPPAIAEPQAKLVIAKAEELAKRMCACQDLACGDGVERDAGDAAIVEDLTSRLDQVMATRLSTHLARRRSCHARLRAKPAAIAVPAPVPVDAPPPPLTPAVPPSPVAVDQLFAAARVWAVEQHAALVLARATLSYVDAEGLLDPEAGAFELELGNAIPVDDPKRRTGIPVVTPGKAQYCPVLRFRKGAWRVDTRSCNDVHAAPPHCTAVEIWQRAIAKQAPRDAVAVIKFERQPKLPPWRFSISDPQRDVSITLWIPDDCERVIEAPPASP